MGMTYQNSTSMYLQSETASVMLGSTAYAHNTWKRSTCWCLCQTNISTDVSVLSQGLPNPVQSRAPALLLCTSFWQGPARQLLDCQVKQLLASFCNSRKKLVDLLAFKIRYLPPETTIYAFCWSIQPSFCHSVVNSGARKEEPEDRNTAGQLFLPILPKLFAHQFLNTSLEFKAVFWKFIKLVIRKCS